MTRNWLKVMPAGGAISGTMRRKPVDAAGDLRRFSFPSKSLRRLPPEALTIRWHDLSETAALFGIMLAGVGGQRVELTIHVCVAKFEVCVNIDCT